MDLTIKQGDCLELMNEIPDKSIDLVLCDLPYGTTANIPLASTTNESFMGTV